MTERWCPYCLAGEPQEAFNAEHVLPAKLGGTLLIDAHERCNGQAALHVDNPLMNDPDVEILRALSGVTNTRTNRFRGAQFPGQLEDDARALLKATPAGITIEQVAAGEPRLQADGSFTVSMPAANIEDSTQKLLKRMQQQFPDNRVELAGHEPRHEHVLIERSWALLPWVWPRFAAKIALGALSLVMPAEWRGSTGEKFLLALFRQGVVIGAPEGLSAVPTHLEEGDPFFDYLYPWEQVITVSSDETTVHVTLVLFGELRYDLGVVTDVKPVTETVWLCDYRENQPEQFDSIDAFASAVTERAADWGDMRHLHLDRPRGQLVGPVARATLAETPLSDLPAAVAERNL